MKKYALYAKKYALNMHRHRLNMHKDENNTFSFWQKYIAEYARVYVGAYFEYIRAPVFANEAGPGAVTSHQSNAKSEPVGPRAWTNSVGRREK